MSQKLPLKGSIEEINEEMKKRVTYISVPEPYIASNPVINRWDPPTPFEIKRDIITKYPFLQTYYYPVVDTHK